MNERKYELMEQHLKGELTVMDLIERIVELEEPSNMKEYLNSIKSSYDVKEYILPTRYNAQEILNALVEGAIKYESVSASDYYDLIGIQSMYVDNQYGWTADTIKNASIVPYRTYTNRDSGYMIQFPPVEVL